MERARFYVAIDLKSFYASVECTQMGLNPLDACLVVADESRTEKTICLAVTPALKSYGIGGRARLFEVVEKVKQVNAQRLNRAPGHRFSGKSHFKSELDADPSLELSFIAGADVETLLPGFMDGYLDFTGIEFSEAAALGRVRGDVGRVSAASAALRAEGWLLDASGGTVSAALVCPLEAQEAEALLRAVLDTFDLE